MVEKEIQGAATIIEVSAPGLCRQVIGDQKFFEALARLCGPNSVAKGRRRITENADGAAYGDARSIYTIVERSAYFVFSVKAIENQAQVSLLFKEPTMLTSIVALAHDWSAVRKAPGFHDSVPEDGIACRNIELRLDERARQIGALLEEGNEFPLICTIVEDHR